MTDETKRRNPLGHLKSSLRDLKERHRDRHRPSGFGFVFADRVDYLDPARWDEVTSQASVFLGRAVLRVIEQHGPANIQPRYAILFRGNKPVAALAAQVVTLDGERLRPVRNAVPNRSPAALLGRMLSPAVKAATSNLRQRMIVAGNLLSWGFHGIGFSPDEDPADLWPGIAEALYRIRRAERLTGQANFVMVKDLTSAQSGLGSLHRFSYRPMQTEPNMVLRIEPAWRKYDDYLGALDAKYRRNAKDQMKKLTAAGCVIERLTDLEPHATRLHELYLAVHENASVRLVTLPATYLPALARAAGENFRCSVVRRNEAIVGFITSLRDGDTAFGYYIGFDRAAAGEGLPIYLRLLHTTVADAIDWGCKQLSLGRTALEPKAALGAKPQEMSVWLRHRVSTLNWMMRGLLDGVPHAEAPERNPFKSTPQPASRTDGGQLPGQDQPPVSF
jgi:hypothetical protein